MKNRIIIIVIVLFTVSTHTMSAQIWEWANSIGGHYDDAAGYVAVAPNGYIYISGGFQSDSIIFGNYTFYNPHLIGHGSQYFLAKYNAAGNVVWASSAIGSFRAGVGSSGGGICMDVNSNIYVTGGFGDSIVFGNFILRNIQYPYFSNPFLVKYDSAGNVLWAKSAYGNKPHNGGVNVATDAFGNVYMAGKFTADSLVFDSITIYNSPTNLTFSYNIFIAKFDSSGRALWAKSIGGADDEFARGKCIGTDTFGNLYLGGDFRSDTIAIGNITLANSNAGTLEMFVAKFDSAGNVMWAKNAGGNSLSENFGVVTNSQGNAVYITGGWSQGTQFSIDSFAFTNPAAINMLYVAKLDSSGNVKWAKSGINGGGLNIATNASGSIYITGENYSDTLVFANDTLIDNHFSPDIFLLKYDSLGNEQWGLTFGGNANDIGAGVACDNSNNIYLTGSFGSSSIGCGNTTLVNVSVGITSVSNDTFDIYIGKIADNLITAIPSISNNGGAAWVYPNPSAGEFNFHLKDVQDEIIEIAITDIAGRNVYIANGNRHRVSISNAASGIYFYRVTTKEGRILNGKILKE